MTMNDKNHEELALDALAEMTLDRRGRSREAMPERKKPRRSCGWAAVKRLIDIALHGELAKRADVINALIDILGVAERRANALQRRQQQELLPIAAE
jgi:hypothetical protein